MSQSLSIFLVTTTVGFALAFCDRYFVARAWKARYEAKRDEFRDLERKLAEKQLAHNATRRHHASCMARIAELEKELAAAKQAINQAITHLSDDWPEDAFDVLSAIKKAVENQR